MSPTATAVELKSCPLYIDGKPVISRGQKDIQYNPATGEAVAEIPRTLSGKKQELPIKRLMLGHAIEKVINKDAMANPGCLDWYVALARRRAAGGATG